MFAIDKKVRRVKVSGKVTRWRSNGSTPESGAHRITQVLADGQPVHAIFLHNYMTYHVGMQYASKIWRLQPSV